MNSMKKFQEIIRMKLFVIVLAFCCSLVISCKSKVDNFNNDEWQKDSIGCNGYRAKTHQLLTLTSLRNYKAKDIEQYLGKPNGGMWYFIQRGVQCKYNYSAQSEKWRELPFTAINFVFDDKDRLISVEYLTMN